MTLNKVEVSECVYSGSNGFSCFHPVSAGGIAIAGNSNDGGILNMNKCIIRDNHREDYNSYGAGGISFGQGCKGYINQCLIESNTSSSLIASTWDDYASLAGGLCIYRAINLDITNSTFYGNSTNQCGGALIVHVDVYGLVNLTNNTIVNNNAGRKAGGLFTLSQGGVINLKNNILANNTHLTSTASQSNDFFNNNGGNSLVNDNGNNIIEYFNDNSLGNFTYNGNSISGNQTNLFGSGIGVTPSLSLNGSTNSTQTVELVAGSVAINAGSSSANALVTVPTIDQRGLNRDGSPDIGSFEFVSTNLPIELTAFNTNCTEVGTEINWQTTTEHNSASFDVEKSRDGNNWSLLESIQAAGNSTTLVDYSVVDSEKATDVVYYQLNQIDQDGASKIYGPISANCNEEEVFTAHVYPNPTKDLFTLELSNNTTQNVSIQLIGTDGKVVYQTTCLVEAGSTIFPLSSAHLKTGIYTLQVNGENSLKTIKLVVE